MVAQTEENCSRRWFQGILFEHCEIVSDNATVMPERRPSRLYSQNRAKIRSKYSSYSRGFSRWSTECRQASPPSPPTRSGLTESASVIVGEMHVVSQTRGVANNMSDPTPRSHVFDNCVDEVITINNDEKGSTCNVIVHYNCMEHIARFK